MGGLRFVSRPGGDGCEEGSYSECVSRRSSDGLLELDDTLKGLLVKSLYSMDIRDEVVRGVLGEGSASFRPGDILGVIGSQGSGKSLLLMHIVAMSILPEEAGGHGQKVFFIDTDSGFSIEVLTEKHLIPMIEKSKDRKRVVMDKVIKRSMENLNVIFANDLLDLLCILRLIINGNSCYYHNINKNIGIDTINGTYINTSNNNDTTTNSKAKLLVIDSLNFWNAESSSFLVNNQSFGGTGPATRSKYHHVLGYYTNRNTLYNSAFSLVRQIVQFHGFIGLVSFCEEPLGPPPSHHNTNTPNNVHTISDKFKTNFTEELVEVINLYQPAKRQDGAPCGDQNINSWYYDELARGKRGGEDEDKESLGVRIGADCARRGGGEKSLMLKFPRIVSTRVFPGLLSRVMRAEDFRSITNLVWITRSSFPISDQIHGSPNSCTVPTYFSCVSLRNLQKSCLAFDDLHGLILI